MNTLTPADIDEHLTPELTQYIEAELASGRYASAGEIIVRALTLLKSGEDDYVRWQTEVRERLKQLDAGDGIVIDGLDELDEFFENVNERGLHRYEARKNGE